MMPFAKSKLFKTSLLIRASLVIFSSAYVTLKSDAIQMSLKYMLLLYTMYCLCASRMQMNATYLLRSNFYKH